MSEVDICNEALANLGEPPTVSSIAPPVGANATVCSLFYPIVLRELLSIDYHWSFAIKRVQLPLLGTPPPEWLYSYQFPADCITPISLLPTVVPFSGLTPVIPNPLSVQQPYAVESDGAGGRLIYTNTPTAVFRYVAEVPAMLFPTLFNSALAAKLTVKLVMPITRKPALIDRWFQIAQLAESKAKTHDARLSIDESVHTPIWIKNR